MLYKDLSYGNVSVITVLKSHFQKVEYFDKNMHAVRSCKKSKFMLYCLPPNETLKARAPTQAKNFHAVLNIKLLSSRKYRSRFGLNRMHT